MKTKTYSKSIVERLDSQFAKQISVAKMSRSFAILLVGMGTIILSKTFVSDPNSSINMLCMTSGAVLMAFGVAKMLWGSREIVHKQSNSPLDFYELTFASHDLAKVEQLIAKRDWSALSSLCCSSEEVRLEAAVAGNKRFAALSVLKYVPYNYQPVSDVLVLEGETEVSSLISVIKA